jgi:hypothetical protein
MACFARSQLSNLGSGLDDFAHEFMAEDVSFLHCFYVTVKEVEVGATNGRGSDLEQGCLPK